MSLLEARAKLLKAEMSTGNGAGPSYPFPVSLEPDFKVFDHTVPRKKSWRPFQTGARNGGRPPERAETCDISVAEIRPSGDDDFKGARAEQLLPALHPSRLLAFEVAGCSGEIKLQLAGAEEDVQAAIRQLSAHYPAAEVFPSEDKIQEIGPRISEVRSYQLRDSYLFQIRAGHPVDPYTTLAGVLEGLEQDECALFQVLFVPTRHDWPGNILRLSRDPWDPAKSPFHDLPHFPRTAESKVAAPLFAVAVRLAASSQGLLDRLEGSFLTLFTSEENRLVRRVAPCPVECIVSRTTHHEGMLFNARELAALAHVPDPDVMPESLQEAEPGAPPPATAVRDIYLPLGTNYYRGRETPVGISAEQLTRHVGFLGGTGYGKTNALVVAFGPHIDRGGGLSLFDFKGDAADRFAERIVESRIGDVVWFDPSDRACPPSFNPLRKIPGVSDESIIGALMVGFHRLFYGHSEFGPQMTWYGLNGFRTMLASEGEKSLRDLQLFYDDPSYRKDVLATVSDRDLQRFWSQRNLRQVTLDALLSRLSAFLDRPTIRDVVSQKPGLIDFHQLLRSNNIFIGRLEKSVLQDATFILGSFMVSVAQLAAMSRRPQERSLHPIIVDEAHNLMGPGMETTAIETFLREGRSYLAPLVPATQEAATLKREILSTLLSNVGCLVTMHLGQFDAQLVSRELGDFAAEDIMDLGIGQAVIRVGAARDSFNSKFPLWQPGQSYREEIIAHSRRRYCRPRAEVEAMLQQPSEPEPQGTRDASEIKTRPELTPDQWRMLEYLADHPDETVTAVYKGLGFSGGRGSKVRQQLRDMGMAVEVETRLGQGNRPAVFLVPTIGGLKVVNKPLRSGRGGGVHRYFQDVVARQAHALGYQANTEYRLEEGGSVDVHLAREGERIAVEIAIQSRPQRECQNIRKCLRAGYDRVLSLFLDPQLLQDTRSSFSRDANEQDRQKVSFLEPERLAEELR